MKLLVCSLHMEEIIIEKVTKYKFVKIGYEPDGHDC
jgi:hypothetical protein